jgi:translation initiation factor 2B subunit (eIF-2B alpha/beta/delta family)
MSTKVNLVSTGLEVRVMSGKGIETIQCLAFDSALSVGQAKDAMTKTSVLAPSMRNACLVFINEIQKTQDRLLQFKGGLKVTSDLLKLMRECEDIQAHLWGLSDDVVTDMRKAGVYADTRSHAVKAWSYGYAIKQGIGERGEDLMLTTSALRSINASFKEAPKPITLEAIMETLAKYLESNPQDTGLAQAQFNATMSAAREMLDQAHKANEATEKAIAIKQDDAVILDESNMTEEQLDAAIKMLLEEGYEEETMAE